MKVIILLLAVFTISVSGAAVEEPKLRFLADLQNALEEALKALQEQVLMPALDAQIKNVALLAAQALAGLSDTGLDGLKSLLGKRDAPNKRIINFFKDLHNDVLFPAVNNLAQTLAGLGAQIFAGLAENGVGRRSIEDFDEVAEQLVDANPEVFSTLLRNGVPRKSIIDSISEKFNELYDKAFNSFNESVKSSSLTIAQFLNDIAINGLGK